MFRSCLLRSYNRYRPWEKSLRRFNRRRRWNLADWLARGTYENLKFTSGWKTTSHINPRGTGAEPAPKAAKFCDMERLHRQDAEYYRGLSQPAAWRSG